MWKSIRHLRETNSTFKNRSRFRYLQLSSVAITLVQAIISQLDYCNILTTGLPVSILTPLPSTLFPEVGGILVKLKLRSCHSSAHNYSRLPILCRKKANIQELSGPSVIWPQCLSWSHLLFFPSFTPDPMVSSLFLKCTWHAPILRPCCLPLLEFSSPLHLPRASLVVQLVKNPPAIQEIPVWFLGLEDPLEEGWATHSIILGFSWWFSW